jgi:hypothetical protein
MQLDPDKRRRLIASARLLESDKEGERHAALEAVLRMLPRDVTLADILARAISPVAEIRPFQPPNAFHPEPVALLRQWQRTAMMLLDFPQFFNERELEFAADIRVRRDEPTQKQWAWLNSLAARCEARMAA